MIICKIGQYLLQDNIDIPVYQIDNTFIARDKNLGISIVEYSMNDLHNKVESKLLWYLESARLDKEKKIRRKLIKMIKGFD